MKADKYKTGLQNCKTVSLLLGFSRDARKPREPVVLSFSIFFSEENRNIPPTAVSLQTYTLHLPTVSCHHLRLSDTVCKNSQQMVEVHFKTLVF